MARTKRLAAAFASVAIVLPLLSAGPAGAAVTAPAGSETWRTGETHNLTWDLLGGSDGTFKISLYDGTGQIDADPSGGGALDDIATGLDSATVLNYSWTIPAGLVGSGRFIRIEGDSGTTPWATGSVHVDSNTFDIAHPLPAITSPTANGKVRVGVAKNITFIVANGSTGTAKLVLKQNGTPVDLIVDADLDPEDVVEDVQAEIGSSFDSATITSVSWTPPAALVGTGYTITLTADSTAETPYGGADIVSGSFDLIPDTSVFEPSASSNWRAEEQHIIKWTAPEGATGTAALWLWNGTANVDADPDENGTQAIATGLDLETDVQHTWLIPTNVSLSNTMRIRLVGDGGAEEYTGAAIVSSPFILRAAPPVPRFTTPGVNQRWHQGESKTITWVVDENATGVADVWLMDSNDQPVDTNAGVVGVQPLANDVDVTAVTTASWTIPSTLSGTGYYFALTNTGALTGDYDQDTIESAPFDVYPVGAAEARIETTVADKASITEKITLKWHDDGATGTTVSIDLLRNDGGETATTTSIVKGLAKSDVCDVDHECEYEWTVPEKTAIDSGAGTYKLRITPSLGASDKTDAFAVVDRALTLTAWGSNKSVKAGEPVVLQWTAAGNLGTLKIEAVPTNNGGAPIVLNAKYDASKETFTWYPTQLQAGKGYNLKVTSTAKTAAKAAITSTTAAAAIVTAHTSITVGSLSGPVQGAVKHGQPIVISWGFGELQNAAVKAAPPVDITLLDASSKVTKVATAVQGDFDDNGKALRRYTYRPSAKLKAGTYQVVVTVTGSTDDLLKGTAGSFTVAAPTAITIAEPDAGDTVERGGTVDVEWAWDGDAELPVNINLLDSNNKATALAKAVVGTDGDGKGTKTVTIPAKGTSAGSYKIQVISADLKTIKAEVAVTLSTPTLAVTSPAGTGNNKQTLYKGKSAEVSYTLGTTGVAPVKLELIAAADKAATKPKVVAVIHKAATTTDGEGTVHFTPNAKIVAGDYVVRATATDVSATAVVSDEFTIANSGVATVEELTGAAKGGTVTVRWTMAQETTEDVKIELFQNGTLVPKVGTLNKKATTYLGYGSYSWTIPAGVTAGSNFTLKVTSLADATKSAESDSFSIAAS